MNNGKLESTESLKNETNQTTSATTLVIHTGTSVLSQEDVL